MKKGKAALLSKSAATLPQGETGAQTTPTLGYFASRMAALPPEAQSVKLLLLQVARRLAGEREHAASKSLINSKSLTPERRPPKKLGNAG